MAKYYVHSGDLKVILDRPTPMDALIDAFRLRANDCDRLSSLTMISETGFEEHHDDTMVADTSELLAIANVEDQFQTTPPDQET